jgi:hypothetical protein
MAASDRRRHERHEVALPVYAKLRCGLRDVSLTGAKLEIDNPALLPDHFLLCIGPDIERWCRVAWRSESEVGIHFIPNPNLRRLDPLILPDQSEGAPWVLD